MSTTAKIGLHSGRMIDLLDPRPSDIRLVDIAHALSNICRFTGACRPHYSVARHSMLVAHLCSPRNKILGLLHDATEAYLGDVSTPLKAILTVYRRLERDMHAAIMESLCLPVAIPAEVRDADRAAFLAEWERFMPGGMDHGVSVVVPPDMLVGARAYLHENRWLPAGYAQESQFMALASEYLDLRRGIDAGEQYYRESCSPKLPAVVALGQERSEGRY